MSSIGKSQGIEGVAGLNGDDKSEKESENGEKLARLPSVERKLDGLGAIASGPGRDANHEQTMSIQESYFGDNQNHLVENSGLGDEHVDRPISIQNFAEEKLNHESKRSGETLPESCRESCNKTENNAHVNEDIAGEENEPTISTARHLSEVNTPSTTNVDCTDSKDDMKSMSIKRSDSYTKFTIPSRFKALSSYSNKGNREVLAPLLKIRAHFRKKSFSRKGGEADLFASDPSADKYGSDYQVQLAPVVCSDTLDQISKRLALDSRRKNHGLGLPTSIAVLGKYIIIGTNRSVVLLFNQSQAFEKALYRGRVHDHVNAFYEELDTLDTDACGISALDVAQLSDRPIELLVVGFSNGRIELWDLSRLALVKSVSEKGLSDSVTLLRFVPAVALQQSRSSQSSGLGQTKKVLAVVVSAHSNGVVNMIVFGKALVMNYADVKCLLDGRIGPILAIAACSELAMVALSTQSDTLIVSLESLSPKVVHKWPTGIDIQESIIPRLSWSLSRLPEHMNQANFVLARSIRNTINFMTVYQYGPGTVDTNNRGSAPKQKLVLSKTAFEAPVSLSGSCQIRAIRWLGEGLLAYIDDSLSLCVLDTTCMCDVERTDLRHLGLISTRLSNRGTSYHNSIANFGRSIYFAGTEGIGVAHVQTWTQRVEILIMHKGWLEALALALDHYQWTGRPLSDLSKLCDLILRFVSEYHSDPLNVSKTDGQSEVTTEKYREFGSACIEFCLEIDKTSLLFGSIYDGISAVGYGKTFLHLLEPYILNRLITEVPPLVLQEFVKEYVASGQLAELEQCILNLSIDTLRVDLHTIIQNCLTHRLLSGVAYIFNSGLNDFDTPAKKFLEFGEIEALLTYIETSFRGLSYPFGFPIDDPIMRDFVRLEILKFTLDNLRPLAHGILMNPEIDDIADIIGLLELGLGDKREEWETKAINALASLDSSEAQKLCQRRLLLHPLIGSVGDAVIEGMFRRVCSSGTEEELIRLVNHCDSGSYDSEMLAQNVLSNNWKKAGYLVLEKALQSTISDGSDEQAIQKAFQNMIFRIEKPASFLLNQWKKNMNNLMISRALKNATRVSLTYLLPEPSPSEIDGTLSDEEFNYEMLCAQELVAQVFDDYVDLNEYPRLQFLYMKSVFFKHPNIRGGDGDDDIYDHGQYSKMPIERYIELLCVYEPSKVYEFVSNKDGLYSIDDVLKICSLHDVIDAKIYLLERIGESETALDILLEVFTAGKKDDGAGSILSSQHSLVKHAIGVCERNYVIDIDKAHAESLWFKLLNCVSMLQSANLQSETTSSWQVEDASSFSTEPRSMDFSRMPRIAEDFYSVLLRNVLDSMMATVEAGTILRKLALSRFVHARHAVNCMLQARSSEKKMLTLAKCIVNEDLSSMVNEKHAMMAKGHRFSKSLSTSQIRRHELIRGSKSQQANGSRTQRPHEKNWNERIEDLMPRPLVID